MESGSAQLTFHVLQVRLIALVNIRIQNGDFTERGLARLLGISQPQIHNVLKGVRKLRPELADHLIANLELNLTDLIATDELEAQLSARRGDEFSESDSFAWHRAPKRFGSVATNVPKKPSGRADASSRGSKEQAG